MARNAARLQALAKRLRGEHGIQVQVLSTDLTDPVTLRALERRLARDAHLELLVNDAGMGDFGAFASRDREIEEAEIRLNALAVVRLTHAALGGMLRRGRGAVINVSSTAAFQPCPYFAIYGATKAFLTSFTEALHEELRGSGVRVQALCPGLTHTEIFERAGADVSGLPSSLWMEPEALGSGNQWNDSVERIASKLAARNGRWRASPCTQASAGARAAACRSMPPEKSQPTTCAPSSSRRMRVATRPVPQPTSSTRRGLERRRTCRTAS